MISDAQNTKKELEKKKKVTAWHQLRIHKKNLDEKTYIVQHTRERIYNQKKEWASA